MQPTTRIDVTTLPQHSDWLDRLAAKLVRDPARAADAAPATRRSAVRRPPGDDRNARGWLARALESSITEPHRTDRRRTDREARVAVDGFAVDGFPVDGFSVHGAAIGGTATDGAADLGLDLVAGDDAALLMTDPELGTVTAPTLDLPADRELELSFRPARWREVRVEGDSSVDALQVLDAAGRALVGPWSGAARAAT